MNHLPREPISFDRITESSQQPWFQAAVTQAEQAAQSLEQHNMIGQLALANGMLQVGTVMSAKREKERDGIKQSDWLVREAMNALRRGAIDPFDTGRGDRQAGDDTPRKTPAVDWAHGAARGLVSFLLTDQRLGPMFGRMRDQTRLDTIERMAAIIRLADAMRRDAGEDT